MSQYIIYYLDRNLIITDEPFFEKGKEVQFMQPEDISKFLFDFESSHKKKQAVFNTKYFEETWAEFLKNYKVIEAAGGIVKNPKGELLSIFRLGKWDLPKGKMETGENPEETAEREIAEECGINGHKLIGKICDTYHTYKIGNKKILKKTYWYAFTIDEISELTPQLIENIEEAVWIKTTDLLKKLEYSYPSIQQVLNDARAIKGFL